MRIHPIIPVLLVAVLSAGTGAAAGYSIGRSNPQPFAETARLPIYHLAAAPTSTTPPALSVHPADHYEPPVSRPRYMLGTDHGFVTVFYIQNHQDQTLTLKERTRTPESALSPDERQLLSDGIYIYTEEQLIRVLQDYDS